MVPSGKCEIVSVSADFTRTVVAYRPGSVSAYVFDSSKVSSNESVRIGSIGIPSGRHGRIAAISYDIRVIEGSQFVVGGFDEVLIIRHGNAFDRVRTRLRVVIVSVRRLYEFIVLAQESIAHVVIYAPFAPIGDA